MIKKHLHHFNRGMVIVLELFGVMVLIAAAAWLLLIIRLSQGPMNADYLTNTLEKELNAMQSGFVLDVGTTALTWGGVSEPFELEMKNVHVQRSDNTPVLFVDKIGVQLSKRYLVFGKFVPKVIKIHGAALRVIRDEGGSFMLNVAQSIEKPSVGMAGQNDFIKGLLEQMKDGEALGLLIGLRQVVIKDALLLYEDKQLGVSWKSRNSNVTFTRKKGGLAVDALADVDMEGNSSYVRGNFFYSWQTFKPNGIVYFTGFNPAVFAQQSEKLKDLSGVNIPLKGSLAIELDENFKLVYSRFVLGGDKGIFNIFNLYNEPLAVKSLFAQGKIDTSSNKINLEELKVNFDEGPRLEVMANMFNRQNNRAIELSAALYNMPLDSLNKYWPESLAHDAQFWVTNKLSKGIATKATLDMSLISENGDFSKLKLGRLGGKIDFKDITVDYLSPLTPVEKVSGQASYDQGSFNLDINSGTLKDIGVTKSKINITGLDKMYAVGEHSRIGIDISMRGSLRTALEVLQSEPLEYPKKLGIDIADIEGGAEIDVSFNFPLHKDLSLAELDVNTKAKLTEVVFKNVVSEMSLTKGSMNLAVNKNEMKVNGFGELNGLKTDFEWFNSFSDKSDIVSKVEVKLPINADLFKKFSVPEELNLQGVVPSHLTYIASRDHAYKLLFKGDVTEAAFDIPALYYSKNTGVKGDVDLILYLDKNKKPTKITALNLNTEGAVLKGNLDFSSVDKQLKRAVFKEVKIGNTDVYIELENEDPYGYKVKVRGNSFDASKMLSSRGKINTNEEAAKKVTPTVISMEVDKLITSEKRYIDNVKMFMRTNEWNRIDHLEVDGVSGGAPLELRYSPDIKGYNLRFEAGNAGAALSALGITNSMRGGKVVVTGIPNPESGLRDLAGSVMVSDFTLVNVPALGMLLNAMSLGGIVELLNGKGISFKKMGAKFWWVDRGMPQTKENSRLIRIKDGETSGASLGLMFEGDVDTWSNSINMSGTIVPASGINKAIGSIPLLGEILTGGGEGIFAATYKIKGPTDNPVVTINPLSVLAPGILRKLFF